MSGIQEWAWDERQRDFYFVKQKPEGGYEYVWSRGVSGAEAAPNPRTGSVTEPRYHVVSDPRSYFKIGRVCETPFPSGPRREVQIRQFIVIRRKEGYCLCLHIHSNGGQTGVNPDSYAPLVVDRQAVQLQPGERAFRKGEISITLDNGSNKWHAFPRVDFSTASTIMYTSKIRAVGMVDPGYLPRLEEHIWAANELVAAEKSE